MPHRDEEAVGLVEGHSGGEGEREPDGDFHATSKPSSREDGVMTSNARMVTIVAGLVAALTGLVVLVTRLPEHLATRPSWPGHAAYVATGAAYIVSDVLWLRVLATAGNMFTITFSYFHPVGQVLWLPLEWSLLYVCINAIYIVRILRDRIIFLSPLEHRIYTEHFADAMQKADFRKLVRCGSMLTADRRTTLLTEGEDASALFLEVAKMAAPKMAVLPNV